MVHVRSLGNASVPRLTPWRAPWDFNVAGLLIALFGRRIVVSAGMVEAALWLYLSIPPQVYGKETQ